MYLARSCSSATCAYYRVCVNSVVLTFNTIAAFNNGNHSLLKPICGRIFSSFSPTWEKLERYTSEKEKNCSPKTKPSWPIKFALLLGRHTGLKTDRSTRSSEKGHTCVRNKEFFLPSCSRAMSFPEVVKFSWTITFLTLILFLGRLEKLITFVLYIHE